MNSKSIVYIRRFQPPLICDFERINQLYDKYGNITIGIVQVCQNPLLNEYEISPNHPAFNPFSYWERFVWIAKYVEEKHLTGARIIPIPWYLYNFSDDELNDSNKRLWIPERIEVYLPDDCLIYLENDDPTLNNYLTTKMGKSILLINIDESQNENQYIGIQNMIYNNLEWEEFIHVDMINDIGSIGESRIKYFWSKYLIAKTVNQVFRIGEYEMEANNTEVLLEKIIELHKLVIAKSFKENYPEKSLEISELLFEQIIETRTCLQEMSRIEKLDTYGKDPSFAQDRYILSKKIEGIRTKFELDILPKISYMLKLVAEEGVNGKRIPKNIGEDSIDKIDRAITNSQKLLSWMQTLINIVITISNFASR